MHIKDIDLNSIWQDSFGWKGATVNQRKYDDELERNFWIKLAPRYTQEYNLNNDTPLLAEALAKRITPGSSILEIGPGSGNFSLLMAKYAREVIGVDFSSAMLAQLEARAKETGINNVKLVNAKWEDYTPENNIDYIVSINSLYRIQDMQSALMKMYRFCNKGIILLRSIQRPYFYDLYKNLGLQCECCLDYQLLPMYFWQQDIHADVEFLDYGKKKVFADIELVEQEMCKDLGKDTFESNKTKIKKALKKYLVNEEHESVYSLPRTTVVVTVRK